MSDPKLEKTIIRMKCPYCGAMKFSMHVHIDRDEGSATMSPNVPVEPGQTTVCPDCGGISEIAEDRSHRPMIPAKADIILLGATDRDRLIQTLHYKGIMAYMTSEPGRTIIRDTFGIVVSKDPDFEGTMSMIGKLMGSASTTLGRICPGCGEPVGFEGGDNRAVCEVCGLICLEMTTGVKPMTPAMMMDLKDHVRKSDCADCKALLERSARFARKAYLRQLRS